MSYLFPLQYWEFYKLPTEHTLDIGPLQTRVQCLLATMKISVAFETGRESEAAGTTGLEHSVQACNFPLLMLWAQGKLMSTSCQLMSRCR